MADEELFKRLMQTFLGELEEHVRGLNQGLLALEHAPDAAARTEIVNALFRTAHSLKGAARAVDVTLLETTCHWLETLFAAAREGRLALGPDVFRVLFAVADGIMDVRRCLQKKESLADAPLSALVPELQSLAAGVVPHRRSAGRPGTETAGRAPSAPAGAPDETAPRSGEVVRVEAGKLDTLLADSTEMVMNCRRLTARREQIAALQDFVRRWQREAGRLAKPLKKALRKEGNGADPARAQDRREARPLGLAGALLARDTENLRRLGKELAGLAAAVAGDVHVLDRKAADLERNVRQARMVPFAEACVGLDRVVRDLAATMDKEANLVVEGGDVALDRSVVQELKDPLVHLVRNAVGHGIEPPAERIRAGKPRSGRVTVAARLRGGRIEIAIADDGRGLDLAAIREQARRRKLPEPAEERDLAAIIFASGFSTTPIITELSGRGIGLDVVKTKVEALRGTVDFEFAPGHGTRFVFDVPLSLTTIRAVLAAAGGQIWAFDSASTIRLLRVGPADLEMAGGREVLPWNGSPIPVVPLAEVLGLAAAEPVPAGGKVPLVVIGGGGDRVAVAVDELLAEQDLVVGTLGSRLASVPTIAGAATLHSGAIVLVLNSAELVRRALRSGRGGALAAALAKPEPARAKRVLLVEDSLTTRTLEKSILEAAGYEVVTAGDGEEGWRLLQDKGADLVVTDIEMPGLDGFALTEAIRGSKRLRDLPVILVTARETDDDKKRGIESGADAYLVKSAFDQRGLLETIGRLL